LAANLLARASSLLASWMIDQISASNQLRTSSELAPNMFGASSELASVMEFGFKVDAECGKLATELSCQGFASKVANFQPPHLHLTYPTCIWRLRWGWPRLNFAEIFGVRKLDSPGYRAALFASL